MHCPLWKMVSGIAMNKVWAARMWMHAIVTWVVRLGRYEVIRSLGYEIIVGSPTGRHKIIIHHYHSVGSSCEVEQCPFHYWVLGINLVSWAVNVILWVVPKVFGVQKGGGMMEQSLVQDRAGVVGGNAELACLLCWTSKGTLEKCRDIGIHWIPQVGVKHLNKVCQHQASGQFGNALWAQT